MSRAMLMFHTLFANSMSGPSLNQEPPATPAPEPEPKPAQTATAVEEAPPEEPSRAARPRPTPPRPKLDEMPPWSVLLHNDDVNDQEYVAMRLVELGNLPVERAVEVMLEAHESGVALVRVTHQEHAELLRDQFVSVGLTVSIEPA